MRGHVVVAVGQSGDTGGSAAPTTTARHRRTRVALALTTVLAFAPLSMAPAWATGAPPAEDEVADEQVADDTDTEGLDEDATDEEATDATDGDATDEDATDEDATDEESAADEEPEIQLLSGPPAPSGLPAELDVNPGWNWPTTCDPQDRPGVEAVANLLIDRFGHEVYTSARTCLDYDSEHHEGRAIDWNLDANDPEELLIADSAVAWLIADDGANARRLGVQQVIWNHEAWYNYEADRGMQPYHGPSPHTDHIHLSLTWDGAYLRTSWWTGIALTEPDLGPCRVYEGDPTARYTGPRYTECTTGTAPATGLATVLPGNRGEGVAMVQGVLGVAESGTFDDATQRELLTWQAQNRLPVSGVIDQATLATALDLTGGRPAAEDPVAEDEDAESTEDEAEETSETAEDTSSEETADAPAPTTFDVVDVAPPGPTAWTTEFTPFFGARLGVGDSGDGVRLLQQALGLEDDGVFGAQTAAAVREYTAEHPWLATSERTSPLLWQVLELQYYPTVPLRANTLAEGETGRLVEVLQEQLDLDADGAFGPGTRAAVEQAQTVAGLPVTGEVDPATWAAVDEAHPDGEFHGDLLDVTDGAGDAGWFVPLADGYEFVDGLLVQQSDTLSTSDR